jgi:uncharacterized RDD family membrane protein YckC
MTFSDEQLKIDTPENVAFNYQVAGIGSRFLAALVDTTLILVLQAISNLALFLIANSISPQGFDWESGSLAWIVAIFGLVAFAFLWGYYVFFEMLWNGQSPGKRWARLRVIRTDGTPITLTESIVRNLVRLIDFMPAYYGIGIVTMFLNDQSRRLGDLAGGTLVVHVRERVTLESLDDEQRLSGLLRTVPSSGGAQASWPVEKLTSQDVQMLQDFARRRYSLSNRTVVAQHILEAVLERMQIAGDGVTRMRTAEGVILDILKALDRERQDLPGQE